MVHVVRGSGLMCKSAGDYDVIRQKLRTEMLNEYPWEESVLFTCERVSRSDQGDVHGVAGAILETNRNRPNALGGNVGAP
jgi:hypothetical protein